MGTLRQARVIIPTAILCAIGLTVWYRGSTETFAPQLPLQLPNAQPGGDASDVPILPVIAPDAHKLPTADSFLPHFEAVIGLKGLTMAEAKAGCTWAPEQKVNFQFGQDADWVVTDRSDEELDFRRRQWHAYVALDMIPFSQVQDKFSGRGLVICAGNQDTLMRVKVILRALVKLGSSIPIEIHYWDDEMNYDSMKELTDLYPHIYFNDLSGAHNIIQVQRDHFWINYQLKSAALLNSRWAEPLMLDSDNIPIIDPAEIYTSAQYAEFGTIFWPDIARSWPQNPAWAITNTVCRMNEYEQESGQLLVDKRRFWYHLQLAAWLNNAEGKYYNEFLLGDKDCFRFAWHALKTDYGRPKKWLTSVGTANDGFYCGHSFAQHHPDDGRVAFLHGGLVKTVSLEVMDWNRKSKGGYYRNYKKVVDDEDLSRVVNVAIKWDGGTYYPDHSSDFEVAQCTDIFEVEPGDINDVIPELEKTIEEIGGYWQLENYTKPPVVPVQIP